MKRKTLLTIFLIILIPVLSACQRNEVKGGKEITTTLTSQNFTSLNLKTIASDVELRESKHPKIVYQGANTAKPKISLNNGTVTVNQNKVATIRNFSWWPLHFYSTTQDGTITIYLPKNKLKTLSVSTEDGDIDCYGNL